MHNKVKSKFNWRLLVYIFCGYIYLQAFEFIIHTASYIFPETVRVDHLDTLLSPGFLIFLFASSILLLLIALSEFTILPKILERIESSKAINLEAIDLEKISQRFLLTAFILSSLFSIMLALFMLSDGIINGFKIIGCSPKLFLSFGLWLMHLVFYFIFYQLFKRTTPKQD